MMKVWIVCAFVLGLAGQAGAQTPGNTASPLISLTGGAGNSMGGFGAQVERYIADGRASVVGGAGYFPAVETGDSSGPAFAGGVRLYTAATTHRLFLEGSVSPVLYRQACFDDCDIYYGPGVQGGYQFVSRRGLTVAASVGAGYGLGVPAGTSGGAVLANIGVGYTWRR